MSKLSLVDTFFRVFPAPRFLSMPAVGLDISDTSVRFLELVTTSKGIRVGRHGAKKISPSLVSGGKITNPEKLSNELEVLREEFRLDFVNVALPEEQVYVFQTTIPTPPKERIQLRMMVEAKIEENVPISPSEAVFDFEILHTDNKDNHIVNVAVYAKEVVNEYIYTLGHAGFKPVAFEVEAQAIARAILPRDNNTYMVVDFGGARTGIAIVRNGALRVTSTINVGGDAITTALQHHLNLTAEEIDQVKNEKGFAKFKGNVPLFESLMSTLSALRVEVEKRHSHWDTHSTVGGTGESEIKKILLCGGSSNLAGLSEFLSSTIDTPVELANIWRNVSSFEDHVPKIEQRKSLSYATSIGLALRGFQ